MKKTVNTEYSLGQVVKHKYLDFRGVIYDVDPEFNNTEEWYQSIPAAIRPKKDQPFYHVFAENDQVFYSAYVSQQNLAIDDSQTPVEHPDVLLGSGYRLLQGSAVKHRPNKRPDHFQQTHDKRADLFLA